MVCLCHLEQDSQEGSLYERNQHFPRSADRAVHDPAAPLEAQGETTDHGVWITKDVPILWIDHISTESPLLGVRQALDSGGVLDFKEMNGQLLLAFSRKGLKT
jgi:hypothetical protein